MGKPGSKDRIDGELYLKLIVQDPFDLNKGIKVAVETPIGTAFIDFTQEFFAARLPFQTYEYDISSLNNWSESNQPTRPNNPAPNPPPGPRRRYSCQLEINIALLNLENFVRFIESQVSASDSIFGQLVEGRKLVQLPFSPKDEYGNSPLDRSQRKKSHNTIHVRLTPLLVDSLLDELEKLRHYIQNQRKVQNEASKEPQDFANAAENAGKLDNEPQPPTNPEGEEFIPEPKPQVPFRQVEPNTPGKDLEPGSTIPWIGETAEPEGPRGDVSNLVSTLPGEAYSDEDSEVSYELPISELGKKRPHRPRPGLPTYPPRTPKPDRTPKPKTKPKPQR